MSSSLRQRLSNQYAQSPNSYEASSMHHTYASRTRHLKNATKCGNLSVAMPSASIFRKHIINIYKLKSLEKRCQMWRKTYKMSNIKTPSEDHILST